MAAAIEVEIAEHVMTITLDRPANLNAFNLQMAEELLEAFDRADVLDEVRAVVVTGRGRAFCAGADMSSGSNTFARVSAAREPDSAREADSPDPVRRDGGGRVVLRIFRCLKPVIAAINGPAVGVGITMCLPMDIRIASSSAKFGFVFVKRGIVPEATSTWFLPRIVGLSTAMDWFVTGRIFGADEALSSGLVSRLVPPGEELASAVAVARDIAENTSPVSVALARQMVLNMTGVRHPMEAHRVDSLAMQLRGRSADAREGVQSFLEKRPPRFPMLVSDGLPDLGFDDPPYEVPIEQPADSSTS
jgi:enoyl-CoA hydratase/carnithine racemase